MLRSLNGTTPVANAKPVRERDYSVEVQQSGPATLPAIYRNLHLVTVCLSGELPVLRERAGERSQARFAPGESSIHPVGPGSWVTWPAGAHCLYVHLHPRLIRRLGETIHRLSEISLETRPWLRDPVIREIGFQLHATVSRTASIDMRAVHDLVLALAHHLVSRFAARAGATVQVGTLSVEEILNGFRENTVSWDGVTAVAARAGLTRPHFSRRMRVLTGMSPYAMVLGSRLEAAKALLERRDVPISEVAYLAGFADQSHLTRVFQRLARTTPARYRAMRRR